MDDGRQEKDNPLLLLPLRVLPVFPPPAEDLKVKLFCLRLGTPGHATFGTSQAQNTHRARTHHEMQTGQSGWWHIGESRRKRCDPCPRCLFHSSTHPLHPQLTSLSHPLPVLPFPFPLPPSHSPLPFPRARVICKQRSPRTHVIVIIIPTDHSCIPHKNHKSLITLKFPPAFIPYSV